MKKNFSSFSSFRTRKKIGNIFDRAFEKGYNLNYFSRYRFVGLWFASQSSSSSSISSADVALGVQPTEVRPRLEFVAKTSL